MKAIPLTGLFFLFTAFAIAQQAGAPDASFSGDGKVATTLRGNNGMVNAAALQPDGKILVAGSSSSGTDNDFTVARYLPDGSLDSSFSTGGFLHIDFTGADEFATAIAFRALDEKIIVGGYAFNGADFDFALAQYHADGTPDAGFGSSGKVITPLGATSFVKAIALQDDGKILLAGYSLQSNNEFALARYNLNGTPDSTFDADGSVFTSLSSEATVGTCIIVQPDNKIVMAGQTLNGATLRWDIGITRYLPDGALDTSFSGDGAAVHAQGNLDNFINAAALQSDGKIIVAGYAGTSPSNNNFLLARYTAHGDIDSTFGTDGFLLSAFSAQNNQATALLMQPDDKFIAGGYASVNNTNVFALARYLPDGSLDSAFGTGGKVITSIGSNDGIKALVWDTEGKIVAAGNAFNGSGFDFAVARYLNDISTSVRSRFPEVSVSVFPNPVSQVLELNMFLQQDATINIELFDVNGRKVCTFLQNEKMPAGRNSRVLQVPGALPAGMYYFTLSSPAGLAGMKKLMKL